MTTVGETKKRINSHNEISKQINVFKTAQNEPDLNIPRRKIEWTCHRIVCRSVGLTSYFSLSLVFLSFVSFFPLHFFLFLVFCFAFVSFVLFGLALCCFTSVHSIQQSKVTILSFSASVSLSLLSVSYSFPRFTFALCDPRSHSKDMFRPQIYACCNRRN